MERKQKSECEKNSGIRKKKRKERKKEESLLGSNYMYKHHFAKRMRRTKERKKEQGEFGKQVHGEEKKKKERKTGDLIRGMAACSANYT